MPCPSPDHLSDVDLLLAADHEIPERFQAHLAGCDSCRDRQTELQSALQTITQRILAPLIPSIAEARAQLERKLAELREHQEIADGMLVR